MIDLHTHTAYSDGTDTPTELVQGAYRAGLRILALTDHDCTDGLAEALAAAADCRGLEIIPGVELSCREGDHEVHVLGYFLELTEPRLQTALTELRAERLGRADRMLAQLVAAGIRLDPDRVAAIAGTGSTGRPHVARALVEAGHARDINDAFDRYLKPGRPGYVARRRLAVAEAIDLIRAAGGAASLAHPLGLPNLPGLLERGRAAGLAGLEAHYGRYTGQTVDDLVDLADRYDLIPTGGSDYHGHNKEGVELGNAEVPIGTVTRLRARAENGR